MCMLALVLVCMCVLYDCVSVYVYVCMRVSVCVYVCVYVRMCELVCVLECVFV